MNSFSIAFLLVSMVFLLLLPRRWAPLPFLLGACYMTVGQMITVGPLHFTVIRILVVAGLVRVILRGERLVGRMNGLDWMTLIWAIWALFSSVFHNDFSAALVFRLGLVYDACGIYFLLRIYCQSLDDVVRLCRITALLLLIVGGAMIFEKVTVHNLFSALGGVPETPAIRGGKIRAQGPFVHAILAGTVGAVCMPLIIGLWKRYRKESIVGIVACLLMIYASTSSGPILSLLAGIGALAMWRFRYQMRLFRWLAVLAYIVLDLIMKDPAYYIIGHLDMTGTSTGWHRANLIRSAIEHLSEWWLGGTDYTRHWMPTGVSWSMEHTDITNHYLHFGVVGGLPLMILFIATLARGFSLVGRIVRQGSALSSELRFMGWALGASLFAHAATFVSVSYFDQSVVFLYLNLAAIGSAWSQTFAGESKNNGSLTQ